MRRDLVRYSLAVPFLALAACYAGGDAAPAPQMQSTSTVAAAVAQPTVSPEAEVAPPPLTEAQRHAFDDVDPGTLRDPFQRAEAPTEEGASNGLAEALQRRRATVPFSETEVRELVVRGTVRGDRDGYAIIADAQGKSVVVPIGSRIGRATVRGSEIIDWRVHRVRDGEVVLVEQSLTHPDQAPSTYVLASAKG